MNKLPLFAVLLGALATAAPASPAAREWRTYSLPSGGALLLEVPAAWKEAIRQKNRSLPPTIVLRPKKGQDIEVMLTPIPAQGGPLATMAGLEAGLIQLGTQNLPTARQESVTLKKLEGEQMTGRYFVLTEKQTPPGEHSSVISGGLLTGPLVVSFTILLDDPASDEARDALQTIQSARFQSGHIGVYRAALNDLRLNILLARAAGLEAKILVDEHQFYGAQLAGFLVEAQVIEGGSIRIRIDGADLDSAQELLETLTRGFERVR